MGISIQFGNKTISEPGSYGQTKSKVKNPPVNADYSTVLIVDTGLGAGYGGNSINGQFSNGIKAVQFYQDIEEMQQTLGGGVFSALAPLLFRPAGLGIVGVSQVGFISARTATPAKAVMTFDNATVTLTSKLEGLIGNALMSSNKLIKGFQAKILSGPSSTTQKPTLILEIYRGTFAGLDVKNNQPFFGEVESNAKPERYYRSDEFSKTTDLVQALNLDSSFRDLFDISEQGGGVVTINDLTLPAVPFTGGTETYNPADLDNLLESIAELDYNVIISDKFGAQGISTENTKILAHLFESAVYDKFLVIAGGTTKAEFGLSQNIAENYDTSKVIVVHGGYTKNVNRIEYQYNALYKAAIVVGRMFGLAPQIPGTFKNIDIDGEIHPMNQKERILAIKKGLLHIREKTGRFVINQSINSLQKNKNLVNTDAQSYEISISRINAQVIKYLILNSQIDFEDSEEGVNRASITVGVAIEWTKTKLLQLQKAGLILTFQDVTAEFKQDAIYINFGYEPNYPVNKLLFTGFVLDNNA